MPHISIKLPIIKAINNVRGVIVISSGKLNFYYRFCKMGPVLLNRSDNYWPRCNVYTKSKEAVSKVI
ncbi:hypothetical protein A3860_27510 [Niastella vici]|uniref:Uncharacterized protein n=1 Tax=Niastella vici TaxID=1703345 RepID=A0A1V9FWQ0_9BACT|nr:hypothetical protein A3860_27510 [Niastella vici]